MKRQFREDDWPGTSIRSDTDWPSANGDVIAADDDEDQEEEPESVATGWTSRWAGGQR